MSEIYVNVGTSFYLQLDNIVKFAIDFEPGIGDICYFINKEKSIYLYIDDTMIQLIVTATPGKAGPDDNVLVETIAEYENLSDFKNTMKNLRELLETYS